MPLATLQGLSEQIQRLVYVSGIQSDQDVTLEGVNLPTVWFSLVISQPHVGHLWEIITLYLISAVVRAQICASLGFVPFFM